ncbi:PTS sugar transporter subunit IIB [Tetragenococcus koreensis]|uniref:Galactitol-specific PTS system IIB component n=1 Tax=Tetragenococcus koreensis TaxID=290335 RepID=A0AAN4RIP8_9ENTE|nr:PTS sugar transporter subunit IIB [Tetragenococcus koreensis]AYW46233.1 PTS galactitol transporter subunit IIB [Tetragenococcus koreensis]MCF1585967.1 PTS sugar transporter subunit IIB [Tetragenococcus koreensis]MCF1615545.1 PTS sugar transporter subunit IIB [Tetragenococcus koreensis]MCF1617805.1 PTS sugar transporter subunit IIB [Tetragenococcus koreensis]MCF1620601.1 PTS sugar transporter subunit IIB [Tetragenococcus koreensis]
MRKIRVLVACGAGIATSTVVTQKVEELFKKNGMEADVDQIKISQAAGKQDGADMLISTTVLPQEYDIPAIKAMSFLTGVGTEETEKEIIDAAKQIS